MLTVAKSGLVNIKGQLKMIIFQYILGITFVAVL